MAKGPGDTRASKHDGNPYRVNGERKEYFELPEAQKRTVQALVKTYANGMNEKLKDKTVNLSTDEGDIKVGFTKRGLEHISRDVMIILSGKYFSKDSLYRIDEMLSQSTYVRTDKTPEHGHGITKFFKYSDNEGRGVYFGVAYNPNPSKGFPKHYLYTITDVLK